MNQKKRSIRKISITLSSLLLLSFTGFSQSKDSAKISISGYVDVYRADYTDSVGLGNFQKFPSVSPRSNEFGLNVAMLTAKYAGDNVRGVITLHYGDIPRSAWDANYNIIQEANAGIRVSKKLWVDAGFFRTHVGTEGLFPKENIASSVAICTFFEPYYEAGFKLNYMASDKLAINLFFLNGYNMYQDNNDKKSLGALVTYAFSDNFNMGYSNYTGDDSKLGDTISHLLVHNCLFLNYQKNKLKIQAGADYCMKENSDTTGTKSATMFAGLATIRYQLQTKTGIYCRGEMFNDAQGLMSGVSVDRAGKSTGLKIWGVTAGIEYKPTDNSYIRLEARQLIADKKQEIFYSNNYITNARTEMMIHMGVSF